MFKTTCTCTKRYAWTSVRKGTRELVTSSLERTKERESTQPEDTKLSIAPFLHEQIKFSFEMWGQHLQQLIIFQRSGRFCRYQKRWPKMYPLCEKEIPIQEMHEFAVHSDCLREVGKGRNNVVDLHFLKTIFLYHICKATSALSWD